jgi:hypothetical protein
MVAAGAGAEDAEGAELAIAGAAEFKGFGDVAGGAALAPAALE